MHARFDRLDKSIEVIYTKLTEGLTHLQNVVKDEIKNAHADTTQQLALIATDLKRLAEFNDTANRANYFDGFITARGGIELESRAKNREHEIQTHLVAMTLWLTDSNRLNNANGGWYIPRTAAGGSLWSAENLQRHYQVFFELFDGPEIPRQLLGYLGNLISTLSGVDLSTINLTRLPNITFFAEGAEAFIQGRLALGHARVADMETDGQSMSQVREVPKTGLRFIEALQTQKNVVMNGLLKIYHDEMDLLFLKMPTAVVARLQTGLVPLFEFQSKSIIGTDVAFSTLMHTASTLPSFCISRVA